MALLGGCLESPTRDDEALAAYREANEEFRQGRFAACIERYEFVLRWRDRIHDAYLKLAECYERTGRPDRAIEVLERSLRVDRSHGEVLARLARLRAEPRRPDEIR